MTRPVHSFKAMIRERLRRELRVLLGPTFFDAAVQFRRMPAWTNLTSEAQDAHCVFIEPHFDDVAFSCGGLLTALARSGTSIDLVTVFTEGPDPDASLSPLAHQLHNEWDTENSPYEKRRQEARRATNSLEVTRRWVGLREVLYRDAGLTSIEEVLQPDFIPTNQAYFQQVLAALEELFEKNLLNHARPTMIFAPLGVGGHIDHLLVHTAIRVLTTIKSDLKTWYYEDFPYVLDVKALKERVQRLKGEGRPTTVDISSTIDRRIELSGIYESQVMAIFQSHERMRENILNYSSFVGTPSRPRERFWSG